MTQHEAKAKLIRITISKTSDGLQEYLQVLSEDTISVNIVLVADKFELTDVRVVK